GLGRIAEVVAAHGRARAVLRAEMAVLERRIAYAITAVRPARLARRARRAERRTLGPAIGIGAAGAPIAVAIDIDPAQLVVLRAGPARPPHIGGRGAEARVATEREHAGAVCCRREHMP